MKIHEHYSNWYAKLFLKFMNKIAGDGDGDWKNWGITFFNHILFSSQYPGITLRSHERVHVNQIFFRYTFSWLIYYPKYFIDIFVGFFKRGNLHDSYTLNSDEDEAYMLQTDSRFAPYVYDKAFQRKIKSKYIEFLVIIVLIVLIIFFI